MSGPSNAELLETLRAELQALTGHAPEGFWRAPGRVNLIGEHTDYNDGYVFPLAIDRHVVIAASPRRDGILRVRSVEKRETVEVPLADLRPGPTWRGAWAAYVAGTAWALIEAGHAIGGADLVIGSTLPAGAGLSSSAALECGTARALLDLHGAAMPDLALARAAQRAENVFVGMPCGLMDQLSSTFGLRGHVLFIDVRALHVAPHPFDLEAAGLSLLVIDTRAHHALVDGGYADRRAACERSATKLGVPALRDVSLAQLPRALETLADPLLARRTRHIVTENDRVVRVADLLREGRVAEIGPLLDASHVSLRDDFQISCAELDLAVETARASGALGARMTGGGFGGSAIALVPEEKAAALEEATLRAFAARGFTRPWIFRAVAADGVHRVHP
ncbi:galactokinase [Pendulispora albinea]|uniref:Galactokinase n=1 Tax=Pendulispora albinea TaxID=2741071 RepID=A0ABZ2M908_9BACT